MKKIILFLTCLSIAVSSLACNVEEETTSLPESSVESSETTSEETTSVIESSIPINEIYEFLDSKYTITAKRESYGNIYTYEYYFDKGIVVGARQKTTFESTAEAEEYLETVIKKYPDAHVNGLSVIIYISDDEAFYYGYTLEKLKFALDKVGYIVTINFDEEAFYKEFPPEIEG